MAVTKVRGDPVRNQVEAKPSGRDWDLELGTVTMRLIKTWALGALALSLTACGGTTSRTSTSGGTESASGGTDDQGTDSGDADGADGDQASTPIPITGAYLTVDFSDAAILGADDVKLHAEVDADAKPISLKGFEVDATVVDGTGTELQKVTVDLATASADFTVARGALETAVLKVDITISKSSGLALIGDDKISFSRPLAPFSGSAASSLQDVRLMANSGISRTLSAASYCDATGYLPAPRVEVAGVATPVATWSPEESIDFQESGMCFATVLSVVGTIQGSLLAPTDVLSQRIAGGPDAGGQPRCLMGLVKSASGAETSLIVIANDGTDTFAKTLATAFDHRCGK
jgi:hypothetical protein